MLRVMRHQSTGIAQALAALALLAMALRALIPVGYMLAPAQDGRFVAVTLCSIHGPAEALIDLDTGALVKPGEIPNDEAPTDQNRADSPCVFATAAPLAAPATPPAIATGFCQQTIERAHTTQVAPGRGLAAPPPWSTGPPLTA